MAKKYGWLDRRINEPSDSYDSRINHLAAFHAGYAFFSRENYDPQYAAFSVYLLWNGEFNSKLETALPDGGFMIHCSDETAERFTSYEAGLPVYVKLLASGGKLSAELMTVADNTDYFDLYFNGCEVRKPDMLYFARRRDALEDSFELYEDETEVQPFEVLNRGSYSMIKFSESGIQSSYSLFGNGSYMNGSFQIKNFQIGSFRPGNRRTGSNLSGSYLLGSYLRGSYLWNISGVRLGLSGFPGSFNLRSLWTGFLAGSGMYNNLLFSGSYSGIIGSYLGFGGSYSWLGGSFSLISGSFRGLGGSYSYEYEYEFGYRSSGSFRFGSFGNSSLIGSFADPHFYRPEPLRINTNGDGNDFERPNASMINGIRPAASRLDFLPKNGCFKPSYRMIAQMGYGLDLI